MALTFKQAPQYIGMTLQEANVQAARDKLILRAVTFDGEGGPITMEYRDDRVNLDFEADKVVDARIY